MPRHTSDIPSHLVMIAGPVARRPEIPYWGYDFGRRDGRTYEIAFDGRAERIAIRGQQVEYQPGVNLVNLMNLGRLVHPDADEWVAQADRVIAGAPGHGDPYPHNMLWGPSGLQLIDGDDLVVETPTRSASVSVRRNVKAWVAGRTTARSAYVAELPGPVRRTRHVVGRVLRGAMGDRAVDRLKDRLHMYGARRG
jgi:hypothetical protein